MSTRSVSGSDAALLILGSVLLVAVVACIIAFPVMLLWNWLMPFLFGLVQINFWEALGLSMLCSLLFKSASSSSK